MIAIKSAEALLFSTTGLDPKEEIRRRLRKKAKKLGKRWRNKKEGSTAEKLSRACREGYEQTCFDRWSYSLWRRGGWLPTPK